MTVANPCLSVCILLAAAAAPVILFAATAGGPGAPPSGAPPPDPRSVERVGQIQAALREAGIDSWLFYDFRGSNPIAARILHLPEDAIATRRWLYFIPAEGEPVRIVHAIEPARLDHLPGAKLVYSAWNQLHAAIRQSVKGRSTVAMEYSPDGAIPYIARVDAGTVELVRKPGVRVVTSADLVQRFEAVWTPEQREQHERAAVILRSLVKEAWSLIARRTRAGAELDERRVQRHLWGRMREKGLEADHPPIVAVGANAADPHYAPPEEGSAPIRRGDLVLIDIWGKLREPRAVYADITWMGAVAETVPERYTGIWKIVRQARDAALAFVQRSVRSGRFPAGWQVDDVARGVILEAGYGAEFIHRTGHSIDEEVHGNGANMDNFETHDDRRLIPGTCFSIEPGIYLPGDFGIRSEIDVYIGNDDATATGGPPQEEIFPIMTLVPSG
jgi:Xaa-Pro aminopeptidase